MVSMDAYPLKLAHDNIISHEMALEHAANTDQMKRRLSGGL